MLPLYVIGGLGQAVSCELASGPLLSSPGGAIVLLPGCGVRGERKTAQTANPNQIQHSSEVSLKFSL